MRRLLRVTSESRYHTFAAPNREDLTAISYTHVLCVMVNIRKSPATPCMTLQYTATHCTTLSLFHILSAMVNIRKSQLYSQKN